MVLTPIRDDTGRAIGFAKVTRDLTERRRAEEELRRSEQRLRLLVESVRDYAIYMLDPEGNISTWNQGAQNLKGYEPSEIVGRNYSAFFTEEDRRAHRPKEELEIARTQGRFEQEGYRVRKDGTTFWASVMLTPITDSTGTLVGFAKVTRDLTRQHEANEALRRSEERFRLLIDSVRDYAIYMLDPDGYVGTWNSGARTLKGYAADEIVGRHYSAFFPEEDLRAGKPEEELEIARTKGRFQHEGYRVRKDGTRFWAYIVLTPIKDATGKHLGFAKVTRDLTARREAEEELRRSEERFRLLIESVRDYAIYMLDPMGNVSTWNAGAENLKGYRPEEIIGRHYSVFFPAEDVLQGAPDEELVIARTAGRFEQEGFRVRKDGTRFWASVVLTPIQDSNGQLIGFAKVTRDLSGRREAEETARALIREQAARTAAEQSQEQLKRAVEAAEQAAKRAEEANRTKDAFLATVSHELRTPLNAIMGWASVLRGRIDAANAKAIEVIHRNAQAQARIIDDILDVSRIVTGKLHLDVKTTDLAAVIRDAVDVVRPSAEAKRVSLELCVAPEVHLLVADPERLQQVAWNLLSNAVKFSQAGGTVTVALRREASRFVLFVADTASASTPTFCPSSSTASGRPTARPRGASEAWDSGSRSSVTSSSCTAVRSASRVRAKAGAQRSRVSVPVRAVVPEGPPPEKAPESAPSRSTAPLGLLNGTKVVLVDDEDDSRELVRVVLENAGAIVETAANGADGFEAVKRFRPDVLGDGHRHARVRRLLARRPREGAGAESRRPHPMPCADCVRPSTRQAQGALRGLRNAPLEARPSKRN